MSEEETIKGYNLTLGQVKAAITDAISQRGPTKGMLKAKAPSDPLSNAAWQALMSVANPYKMNMFSMMCFTKQQEEMYAIVSKVADKNPNLVAMADRDRRALESIGAW